MGTRYSSFPVSRSLALLEPAFSLPWNRTCRLHLQLHLQKSQTSIKTLRPENPVLPPPVSAAGSAAPIPQSSLTAAG